LTLPAQAPTILVPATFVTKTREDTNA
jgi:hypothetical protein